MIEKKQEKGIKNLLNARFYAGAGQKQYWSILYIRLRPTPPRTTRAGEVIPEVEGTRPRGPSRKRVSKCLKGPKTTYTTIAIAEKQSKRSKKGPFSLYIGSPPPGNGIHGARRGRSLPVPPPPRFLRPCAPHSPSPHSGGETRRTVKVNGDPTPGYHLRSCSLRTSW